MVTVKIFRLVLTKLWKVVISMGYGDSPYIKRRSLNVKSVSNAIISSLGVRTMSANFPRLIVSSWSHNPYLHRRGHCICFYFRDLLRPETLKTSFQSCYAVQCLYGLISQKCIHVILGRIGLYSYISASC